MKVPSIQIPLSLISPLWTGYAETKPSPWPWTYYEKEQTWPIFIKYAQTWKLSWLFGLYRLRLGILPKTSWRTFITMLDPSLPYLILTRAWMSEMLLTVLVMEPGKPCAVGCARLSARCHNVSGLLRNLNLNLPGLAHLMSSGLAKCHGQLDEH